MGSIDISDFSAPTQKGWNSYLRSRLFDNMLIEEELFKSRGLLDVRADKIERFRKDYNNKIGTLRITYAFCRYYYGEGIDNSDMDALSNDDIVRLHWFGYYAETYYLKIWSAWDMIVDILNSYYNIGAKDDEGKWGFVQQWLENNKKSVRSEFKRLTNTDDFGKSKDMRNNAAHYAISVFPTYGYKESKKVISLPTLDENYKHIVDENGNDIMETKERRVFTYGQIYTPTADIFKNIKDYTRVCPGMYRDEY